MPAIRPMVAADTAQILSLNLGARPHVASLDEPELARLQALSRAHLVAQEGPMLLGYLLAFARDDAYDGEEFLKLRSLIPEPFVYIDQVVVLGFARKAGVGRGLYEAVEHGAQLRGSARSLCCEVNTTPPNPDSLAFHMRMGFDPVGLLSTMDGRVVKLLRKRLSGENP